MEKIIAVVVILIIVAIIIRGFWIMIENEKCEATCKTLGYDDGKLSGGFSYPNCVCIEEIDLGETQRNETPNF